jgi:hypothetical protein
MGAFAAPLPWTGLTALTSLLGGVVRTKILISSILLIALCGCARQESTEGRAATVALKDGTSVAGTVVKSDTSSVTLRTSNGVVSTYPMNQVASISYGSDTAAPGTPSAAAGEANPPAPATPSAASTPPGKSAVPQPAPPPKSPAAAQPSASASAPTVAPQSTATAEPAPPAPAAEPRPEVTFRTVPSGTTLAVRTDQSIDSQTATPGQTFPGVVAQDVVDTNGRVAIPHGATATLVIRAAQEQGRIKGQSELSLDVSEVEVNGHRYRLETADFVEKGSQGVGANKRTGKFAGGGGIVGGIIGAVAGGGKGAAIGALSGAAAGATAQTLTRKRIRIPSETVLNFKLEAPIRIREVH